MASEEKKLKTAATTGIYLLVIVAIAVLANILSAGSYKRFDVTKNERFTLSVGSGRLVSGLESPVTIDAYITRGTAKIDAFVRDLTDLLKEYERKGGGKFKFTIIEAKTDELKEQAKEAGLQPMMFADPSATGEDQASIAQGYMGLVLKYGAEKATIPQLAPDRTDGLEFWITNKIREIRDKAENRKHRIGVITGKDELKLSDTNLIPKQGRQGGAPSMQSILEQAFPFYKLEEVDLKDGETELDPELAGVIITQPRKDYTEKELKRIDQFVMRGNKSLVVYASAVTLKPNDAEMNADLSLHGLDKLLSGYGIVMNDDAVMDFGAQFRLLIPTQTGVDSIRHPGIAHVINDGRMDGDETLLDSSFAGFFRMDELAFPFPSSLSLKPEAQPEGKVYAVARSTPQTSVVTGSSVSMKLRRDWEPKPPQEQRILAAVAEGTLKSAFGGGGEYKTNEKAPSPSRVLVVSSSEFLTNPFAYSGNGPELGGQFAMFGGIGGDPVLQAIAQPYAQKYLTYAIISLKNTLDWMSGDSDLIAASAKILSEPNLAYTSIGKPKFTDKDDEASVKRKDEEYRQARKSLQGKIQWTLTLALPLVFAGFGIGRWRLRLAKRNLRRI